MYNGIKIAHFTLDEKFLDSAYELFEKVAPNCNTYYIASNPTRLKYVKKAPVTFIHRLSFKNPFFMDSLSKYNFIVLHSLSAFNKQLVLHSRPNLKFIWIGWGFDYYDLIYDDQESLYFEDTKAVAKNYDNRILYKNSKNKSKVLDLARSMIYKNDHKIKVLGKIKYFSPVLKSEYDLIKNKYLEIAPDYIDWNYGVNSELLEDYSTNIKLNGSGILIGNSASLNNNHIEILKLLSILINRNRLIVCPLSYGDEQYGDEYAKHISSFGKNIFGDNFVSLMKFMPYEKYLETVSKCHYVIMNHIRQQGSGVINSMLYLGAKVFLNKINPLYEHFTNRGIKFYSLEDIKFNRDLLNEKLSNFDIENNREIIRTHCNSGVYIGKTRKMIDAVLSD